MSKAHINLLVLMTDHQRADSIGMVQAGVEVTPNLNRLAARAAHFRRCYNTCPLCVPARTALFTGSYPTRNGVVYNDWQGETACDYAPLHQLLAEAGYAVGHVGVHHVRVAPELRDRLDFALWVSEREHREYLKGLRLDGGLPGRADRYKRQITENVDGERVSSRYSNTCTGIWPHAAKHFKDAYWCRRAAEWLREAHERPFALFVHLWAPHPPLVVPQPYASMFDPAKLDLPTNVDVPSAGEPPGRRRGAAAQIAENVSMEQWRRVWAAHLGLVRLADEGLGQILDALGASGQSGRTVVAFTVDHGDHLGQHRMYQKMEMYEQAVRVPLIVRAPAAEPADVRVPVSHLDVMPTLLDLLGLPPPGELDGAVLADCVRTGSRPPDRTLFGQYSGNPRTGDIRRMAVTNRYKYVYDPCDLPELFDLREDPYEMHNLAADGELSSVLEDLHAQCAAWHRSHGDWVEY